MANQTMTIANREFVEEFIRRVFNEHNADATPDYFSPDVQWHGGTLGTISGSGGMTSFYKDLFEALPDLHHHHPRHRRRRGHGLVPLRCRRHQ